LNFSTAAWLSILPFIFFYISLQFNNRSEECIKDLKNFNLPLSKRNDIKEYLKEIDPKVLTSYFKFKYLFFGLGLIGCFLMVLKGIHLWPNWDGINSPALDKTLMKSVVRARRGGIIVLAIQLGIKFLPQFIIFGYGYFFWKYRKDLRTIYPNFKKAEQTTSDIKNYIKGREYTIQKTKEFLLSMPIEERIKHIKKLDTFKTGAWDKYLKELEQDN